MAKGKSRKNKDSNKKVVDKRVSNVDNQIKEIEKGVIDGVFVFTENLTVQDFATSIGKSSSEVLKHFFMNGQMMTLNSMLNEEQIGELCLEWGYDFQKKEEINKENVIEKLVIDDDEKDLLPRPPIITIMGHVDHGKTSLLDAIRKTKVTAGEAGGITQHIGAYQITRNDKKITFIDTPGHAAFTEMRARGANVTDIVIIVVAADDGVKPQTKEAIDHAKAAGVEIIVAINKIDKPNINIEKVKGELAELELVAEEWGGSTIFKEVSALTGKGIDDLLDTINLLSEVHEYKANPNRFGMGTVIEAHLDKSRGPLATIIVQNGTLKKGDTIVAGNEFGRVRTMHDDLGVEVIVAEPSTPVTISGLSLTPNAGDRFSAFGNEKAAREVSAARKEKHKQDSRKASSAVSLDEFAKRVKDEDLKIIYVLVKTDVKGTSQALKTQIECIDVEGTRAKVIRSDVGAINESDVLLASASKAIIYGFNVKADSNTKKFADSHGIEIRTHSIIYKIIEELEEAMSGMLDPTYSENPIGSAEILQLFSHSKIGTIYGSKVTSGTIKRNALCRIMRDGEEVYNGKVSSLKVGREEKASVRTGMECGFTLDKFNNAKEGDVVEFFERVRD